jgi:hypothetical protein
MWLYRRLRLELSLSAGSALVEFFTDLPVVTGGGLAVRHSVSLSPTARKRLEADIRLPGTTKGNSFELMVTPSGGALIMYGAQVEAKRGDAAAAWQWLTIPVLTTPAGWTKLPLPIRPTPADFTRLPLPIRRTPEDWSRLALPITPTPEGFTRIPLPIEQADSTWQWRDLPVQEDGNG